MYTHSAQRHSGTDKACSLLACLFQLTYDLLLGIPVFVLRSVFAAVHLSVSNTSPFPAICRSICFQRASGSCSCGKLKPTQTWSAALTRTVWHCYCLTGFFTETIFLKLKINPLQMYNYPLSSLYSRGFGCYRNSESYFCTVVHNYSVSLIRVEDSKMDAMIRWRQK